MERIVVEPGGDPLQAVTTVSQGVAMTAGWGWLDAFGSEPPLAARLC